MPLHADEEGMASILDNLDDTVLRMAADLKARCFYSLMMEGIDLIAVYAGDAVKEGGAIERNVMCHFAARGLLLMGDPSSRCGGDILNERASRGNAKGLDTAAYAENRLTCFIYLGKGDHFAFIALDIYSTAFGENDLAVS